MEVFLLLRPESRYQSALYDFSSWSAESHHMYPPPVEEASSFEEDEYADASQSQRNSITSCQRVLSDVCTCKFKVVRESVVSAESPHVSKTDSLV